MTFALTDLPYAADALAPHVSEHTMLLHHGKHHRTYVDKLNELLAGDPMGELPLEDVIRKSHERSTSKTVFNNAAQCWNHAFFWNSMTPDGGGRAIGDIGILIDKSFGNHEAFEKAFVEAAVAHFGSGWVWLVLSANGVEVMTTHDADLPLVHDKTALIVCDLWEHAYYLDYENRRAEFVKTFLKHLVNWNFANVNVEAVSQAA
jgi:superoxide dismutase, Fe-Mn family